MFIFRTALQQNFGVLDVRFRAGKHIPERSDDDGDGITATFAQKLPGKNVQSVCSAGDATTRTLWTFCVYEVDREKAIGKRWSRVLFLLSLPSGSQPKRTNRTQTHTLSKR